MFNIVELVNRFEETNLFIVSEFKRRVWTKTGVGEINAIDEDVSDVTIFLGTG